MIHPHTWLHAFVADGCWNGEGLQRRQVRQHAGQKLIRQAALAALPAFIQVLPILHDQQRPFLHCMHD